MNLSKHRSALSILPKLLALTVLAVFVAPLAAHAGVAPLIREKILTQGVPAASLDRILNFISKNEGQTVNVDAYDCKPDPKDHRPFNPVKPCEETDRTRINKPVSITAPRYVVVIDFSLPSTEKRYMFIDLTTGTVEKFLTAHGKGSGDSKWATRFSNKPDSKMTSLGLYLMGGVYDGKYGATGRLFGLERSNDQAYWRDIVAHGAWYAQADFLTKPNPKTKLPFDRLGLSWGCPAIDPAVQRRLLPLLRDGAIFDFYHPALMEAAASGGLVQIAAPEPAPVPEQAPEPDAATAPVQPPPPLPGPQAAPAPATAPTTTEQSPDLGE